MLQTKVLANKACDEETWKPICHIQMSHIVLRGDALQGVCLPFKPEGGVFCNWEQMEERREPKHPNPLSYFGGGGEKHHHILGVCMLFILTTLCLILLSLTAFPNGNEHPVWIMSIRGKQSVLSKWEGSEWCQSNSSPPPLFLKDYILNNKLPSTSLEGEKGQKMEAG